MTAKKTASKSATAVAPKYPRVLVSAARHKALSAEAKKRKINISVLVEEKFKKAK